MAAMVSSAVLRIVRRRGREGSAIIVAVFTCGFANEDVRCLMRGFLASTKQCAQNHWYPKIQRYHFSLKN